MFGNTRPLGITQWALVEFGCSAVFNQPAAAERRIYARSARSAI